MQKPSDSSVETKGSAPAQPQAPATFSLELIWKANSAYTWGTIGAIDLHIDDERRYSVEIPKGNAKDKPARIPFRNCQSSASSKSIDFLIMKNLDIAQQLSLKAGIFNEREGNVMSRNPDGTWSRDKVITRDDIDIDLDCSSFQMGKHYQITITHDMVRRGAFWQGDNLKATVEEAGPAKRQTPEVAPSLSIYNPYRPNPSAAGQASQSSNPKPSLGSGFNPDPMPQFQDRMEKAEALEERQFYKLALEKKYEEAIMFAAAMKNQGLGGRLIINLLKHSDVLNINVNLMNNNPLRQTPAHRTAINEQWHAYYALAEVGANTVTADMRGKTAQDYRQENGMTIFNPMQHQIREDLFGDTAPEAEAFIDSVQNGCRQS